MNKKELKDLQYQIDLIKLWVDGLHELVHKDELRCQVKMPSVPQISLECNTILTKKDDADEHHPCYKHEKLEGECLLPPEVKL